MKEKDASHEINYMNKSLNKISDSNRKFAEKCKRSYKNVPKQVLQRV